MASGSEAREVATGVIGLATARTRAMATKARDFDLGHRDEDCGAFIPGEVVLSIFGPESQKVGKY